MQTPESIRHHILVQLETAYPLTLPLETLYQGLRLAGLKCNHEEILKQLEYLIDKGFILKITNELCPHNKRYKLSTKGVDYLED